MKGIRKLFLGLILLTLFGVGFKVEAKAADLKLKIVQLNADDSAGNKKGDILVQFNNNDMSTDVYPVSTNSATDPTDPDDANNTVYTYTYSIKSEDGTDIKTGITLTLTHVKNGTPTYYYKANGGAWTPITTFPINVYKFTAADLAAMDPKITGSGDTQTGKFVIYNLTGSKSGAATSLSPTSTLDTSEITIKKYKLTLSTKYRVDGTEQEWPEGCKEYTLSPASPVYLYEGQTQAVSVSEPGPGKGYKVEQWKAGSAVLPGTGYSNTATMGTEPLDVICYFTKISNALQVPDLANNTYKIIKNKESKPKSYTVTGYAPGDIKKILIDGTALADTDWSNDTLTQKLTFKAPSTTGAHKLTVKMDDGQTYDFTITVVGEVTFSLNSSYTVGLDSDLTITPTYSVEPTNVAYAGETGYGDYFTLTEDSPKVKVHGKKATSSGYKVTATATFPAVDGYDGTALKATTTIKVESLQIKDAIYVSKDKKVTLSDFIKSGSASMEVNSITNNAESYIELNKTSGACKDITIKGKSSGTKDDSLIIDGEKIDVTVYPEPKLSVETTGAGSSYKQTYTVKMPKGVYHDAKDDGWWIESLSKAKLVFKASSNSDKTREVTVDNFSDSNSSDEKLMKKATKELKTSDLNVIFRDLCKNDSDTISVIAYPYNTNKDKIDTEIASEKKEFTVYKITMDTSGGANYTVNGESVSDYFYGIDGVTYEIKSSGKTANAKLNKDTSSSEFGSGETIQYKVAGARTLKAVYGGGSNNEGGGGNMDDYDDVPKTGESKADIWILWSVLFIAILGAGFMIWKRFGLVRAIAAAEEEYAIAEEEERIETEKKEKEDKLNMLKDLRNL